MLEISDAWSYQDINHILTTHDTHQHMYRVIPMISSPIATTVAEYSNDGHSRDSEGSPSFRRVVMSRLRTYLPLLRYVLILACTFFLVEVRPHTCLHLLPSTTDITPSISH